MFPRSEPVKAVLFDAHGVIYYRPREASHLDAFLRERGIEPVARPTLRALLAAERLDAYAGRMTAREFNVATLRAHGVEDADDVERGLDAMREDARDVALYPGVVETLEGLSASGLRLGIVTDTLHTVAEKLEWMEGCGIRRGLFGAIASSVEVGASKPDPAIYRAALDALGVEVRHAVFVGHATDELEGAAALGLATVAFRPDDPAVPADARTDNFIELRLLAG